MMLLQPIQIAGLELKNRILMAPMGAELGNFDERSNAYYISRAQGGASMIMVNVLATDAIDGPSPAAMLTEESYEGFARLVEAVHGFGCKLCVQIMPGTGLGQMAPGRTKPASASAVPLFPGSSHHFAELTHEEIRFIQAAVNNALLLAKRAGADAVEIHAYGGYLTDRFMTKRWNVRTDEYGGSLENRLRFLTEIIESTQQSLGQEFPLIVKFTPCHFLPEELGYRDFTEGLEIARRLEKMGVHALHIDAGCHDNWYMAMPPVYQQAMAPQLLASLRVREASSLPLISTGRLGDVDKAESALRQGLIDIVGIGRGLLADPDIPLKLMHNKADEIRTCISCNEGCIKSVTEGRQIDCAVNPLAGYETEKAIPPTSSPKRLLIIGAGPGGCHAAIAARQAGHDVEIWEKTAHIGGNFHNACMPPFKRDGAHLLNYYSTMLGKLEIRLRTMKEATKESVLAYKPDLVIYAAGGKPVCPRTIEGITTPKVKFATDVLNNQALIGEHAVIIGGGLVGCETALTLALQGKRVTIIEMADKVLPEPMFIQNYMMLTSMLLHPNIKKHTSTKLAYITDEAAVVETSDGKEKITCDCVVLAMGFTPNDTLCRELQGEIEIVNIGDSVRARKVFDAVKEAHEAVRALG